MTMKLEGSIGWARSDNIDDGEVHRVILRDNGELVIDVTCGEYRFSAPLKKVSGSSYSGKWACRQGKHTYSDNISCTIYSSEEGLLLFGNWREDGANYYWWAELSEVEQFSDEIHVKQGAQESHAKKLRAP